MFFNEDMNSTDLMMSEGVETSLGNQLVTEAVIQDALNENQVILDEDSCLDLLSEELLSERNIIKFDKYAKRKHATNKTAVILAKENNDKNYKKLVLVYKMRKKLLAKIMTKYGNKAKIRVRENERNNKVSQTLAKIKDKAHIQKKDM